MKDMLRVAPLFETLDDLEHSESAMDQLLSDPWYSLLSGLIPSLTVAIPSLFQREYTLDVSVSACCVVAAWVFETASWRTLV